jgi:hypothetical protein
MGRGYQPEQGVRPGSVATGVIVANEAVYTDGAQESLP